ncbi:MAG: AAA family ATPase, partial [Planctomycetes bacterium]|nr:AAA family ATPase [Planctomycetota bacterium]
ALVSAAVLSNRYISDRFLPDMAIDLIDEAGASIRTEIDSLPEELDTVQRRTLQLEIEREALRKEKDPGSKERLVRLDREIAELKEKGNTLRAQWEKEKGDIAQLRNLRKEIDETRLKAEEAERAYDLNRAAELKYGKLNELEQKLKKMEAAMAGRGDLAGERGGKQLVKEEVAEEEVAEIVARWTGIPVTRLLEGEREKLLKLDQVLHQRVIGQDEAVAVVSDAVIRSRSGLKDPRRPIGSFIFLGPTGVGKTELARALAEALFDTEENMVRIDMSEYQEKHTVSRLIGAPPGYVGYEEGGQLTEAVRRKPYSIVLFDEIEKAHPEVFNALLQLLDDGRLTDGHGRLVNFRNTVVIMTSNIGSPLLLDGVTENGQIREGTRRQVMEEMRRTFRPEFLNRVDETILFSPLTRAEVEKIVELQLEGLRHRLAERRIVLELTPECRRFIAEAAYDPTFGARPVKRFIQRHFETALGRKLIAGEIAEGSSVKAVVEQNDIAFKVEKPSAAASSAAGAAPEEPARKSPRGRPVRGPA